MKDKWWGSKNFSAKRILGIVEAVQNMAKRRRERLSERKEVDVVNDRKHVDRTKKKDEKKRFISLCLAWICDGR